MLVQFIQIWCVRDCRISFYVVLLFFPKQISKLQINETIPFQLSSRKGWGRVISELIKSYVNTQKQNEQMSNQSIKCLFGIKIKLWSAFLLIKTYAFVCAHTIYIHVLMYE